MSNIAKKAALIALAAELPYSSVTMMASRADREALADVLRRSRFELRSVTAAGTVEQWVLGGPSFQGSTVFVALVDVEVAEEAVHAHA